MSAKLLDDNDVASNIELFANWVEAQMAYRGQPGLSIGIVYDQALIWSKGFGYANLERQTPATPQTIYRIASITKLFTSTAILQLRDAGKLQLDDPIVKHLPWFNIQNRHPDAPTITIRHLITHTSGLPRESAFAYWNDSQFPTREQILEKLPDQQTILPSETEWKYSNLALTLAGEIVAAVSEKAYTAYVRDHILQPLGMHDTFVETIASDHSQLASGYGRRLPDGNRKISPFTNCQGITPAANMATTVEDLARFAMLQFRNDPVGGEQILKGSTLKEMHRIHWLQPDWKGGWGLGFRVDQLWNKTIIGHGGAVQGFRTQLHLCPDEKFAVITLTNADDGNPLMYSEKAFAWVAPAVASATKLKSDGRLDEATLKRYVGKYRDAWGDYQFMLFNGGLIVIDPSLPDPMLTMSKLIPESEHTFRIETTYGGGSNGEWVAFDMNEDGTPLRVKIGQHYCDPVDAW